MQPWMTRKLAEQRRWDLSDDGVPSAPGARRPPMVRRRSGRLTAWLGVRMIRLGHRWVDAAEITVVARAA